MPAVWFWNDGSEAETTLYHEGFALHLNGMKWVLFEVMGELCYEGVIRLLFLHNFDGRNSLFFSTFSKAAEKMLD